MDLSQNWRDLDWVAFDTETTGKYPLESEICEIAAVKWRAGEIVDEFQTLIRPSRPMGDEVIAIHHITNQMVENAPRISEKIGEFRRFIRGAVTVAHHAPFDLGFLTPEFEKQKIDLPLEPVVCSSLLARKMIPESGNHRLQTLIRFLGLPQGQAHRALDDARACLMVALRSLERLGENATLQDAIVRQGADIRWQRFSMNDLRSHSLLGVLVKATENREPVQLTYDGGSRRGQARTVNPIGIVRSLEQDFLVASDEGQALPKRYFLDKITNVAL